MVVHPIGWIIGLFKLLTNLFGKLAGSSNPVISTIGKIGKILVTVLNPISLVI